MPKKHILRNGKTKLRMHITKSSHGQIGYQLYTQIVAAPEPWAAKCIQSRVGKQHKCE
jgi:hypothetical protein